MAEIYSYHVFYFPFKWKRKNLCDKLFEEQISLDNIQSSEYSRWERCPEQISKQDKDELYNEQNYYFQFVHKALYDNNQADTLVKHYERKEPKTETTLVTYNIAIKNKVYILNVDSINLNFYSTGVGILAFFLKNEEKNQSDYQDILNINQFGRRVMPPFIADVEGRFETAQYISIDGLDGSTIYKEDFDGYTNEDAWKPASFITNLITDLSSDIHITPVIDDRMFVNSWYVNDDLAKKIEKDFATFKLSDEWYKYVFVDAGWPTCQNDELRKNLIEKAIYTRWQKYGSMYGVSRYSFMFIGSKCDDTLRINIHMRTIYSRMIEFVLVQRASVLRFSDEVTHVSRLSGASNKIIARRISSLYKEYIRFINQIYFQDVSAQDQGIELYHKLIEQFDLIGRVKELDEEIGELHRYITLLIDQKRNENSEWLNVLAAIFLPATIFTGLFGMNSFGDSFDKCHFVLQTTLIFIASVITYFIIEKRRS